MTLAYRKPGVSVSEISSPSFNPQLLDPTSVCVVGPAQGFQNHVEVFVLNDNHPVTLSATYPDLSTLIILDATNVTLAPFTASTNSTNHDYDIDSSLVATTGQVALKRSMQTTIIDGQKVFVSYSNGSPTQGNSHTEFITLNGITPVGPPSAGSGLASLVIGSIGIAPAADYTITGNGGATPAITWVNTASVLSKFQTVYVDYTVAGVTFLDLAVQLNNLAAVSLPANATIVQVSTGTGTTTTQAVKYAIGTVTTNDYIVSGTDAATTVARSAGTTTIGGGNNKLAVRVSYQATPVDYWLPTRCFSQADVEAKYGPAFDATGNIINPASFGASLAFQNGLNSVIVQALFTAGTPKTQPTGSIDDWDNTYANLYNIEDLNVVVPLISTGTLTANDGLSLQILTATQSFLNYMALQQNQLVIAICGEDSTSGSMASESVLQAHAGSLGSNSPRDSVVMVSPGSFSYTNPVTGNSNNIGGQYAAACVAGMLGRYPVQTPLTRKRVNVLTGVNDPRTETQKNQDAAAGLCVIESKRGVTQVRHAITVATDSIAHRELNVTRGKHWMMQNIQQNIDQQIIGQIVIDQNAAFQIQLVVTDVLEMMLNQGAIVSYDAIQVSTDPSDSTAMQVRFSYLPAFPLNTVNVQFSINSTAGVLFSTNTSQTSGI